MYRYLSMFIISVTLCAQSAQDPNPFGEYVGTMVIFDEAAENFIIYDASRAAEQFSPFSTHKIAHSLIALETGAVKDLEQVLSWDTLAYPKESWWPSTWEGQHTLGTAIAVSLVPAYRQIARNVGPETMQKYLEQFSYGNADRSSGADSYWLNGSLKISAMEQVAFLRNFYHGQLGLSERTTELTKAILVRETGEDYSFSHKTGTGTVDRETGNALAWLVGYVERGDQVYFFAMNMEGGTFDEIVAPRMTIALDILRQHNILD